MTIRSIAKRIIPHGPLRDLVRTSYGWSSLQKARLFPNGCKTARTREGWELTFNHPQLEGTTVYPDTKPECIAPVMHELPSYFPLDVPKDALIVDAGAFPGDFTVAAARLVPGGKVIALEPNPLNLHYLKQVLERNGVLDRVEVLPYALSDVCGNSDFVGKGTGSHLTSSEHRNGRMFRVETVTLDALLSTERRRPVIKMDIEGAELPALEAAARTLRNGADFAIAAYHMVRGEPTYKALQERFGQWGYKTRLGNAEHLVLFASSH